MPDNKPKIFITAYCDGPEWWVGTALAEDGTGLASHVSSNKIWVRHDMGLEGTWKHQLYLEHYPDGYVLVDLVDATDEELQANELYMEALAINRADDIIPGDR